MLEHDCDTDEDCEVYFLKPVNEYNIVDKIKEANKELFDEGEAGDDIQSEQRRKVQFRTNLEDYEPNTEKDPDDEDPPEDKGCYVVLSLDEGVEESAIPSERTISAIKECAEMLALEVQKKIEAIEIKMPDSDEEVEEICEEIIVMDMDTGRRLDEDTNEINTTKVNVATPPIYSETQQEEETAEEVDSNDDDDVDDDHPKEEDDDDKLSIIVASYLPPDPLPDDDDSSGKKNFSRHFSFRRKNTAKRLNCRSPDITSLKLNYKTCCEYRNSEGGKLPKYTGYMSEYGLSRDQLDKREQTLQKKHKVVGEKNLKATEAEVRKMQDNERAFTTWLKNKMRFPINRTKNMFDVKKASGASSNGRSGIFRQKFCTNNKSM